MVHEGQFKAQVKCCAYYPDIPNFMAGAILQQKGAAARVIETRLQSALQVSPLGVKAPAEYVGNFRAQAHFGIRPDLICPFFQPETDNCGIWNLRPSTCTTYFCKSSYGEAGQQFWQNLDRFLGFIEMSLSQHALLAKGFIWPEIEAMLEERESGWAHWSHAPTELFAQCWLWVQALNPTEMRDLITGEGERHLAEVIEAYRALCFDEPQFITR
jgi:Fe-S-cluster containining protein